MEKHFRGSGGGGGEGENVHDFLRKSQCHRPVDSLYPMLGTMS